MATRNSRIKTDFQSLAYSFGNYGLRYLTSGSTPEGEYYYAIFANEISTISATSMLEGTESISDMPIPAGSFIYGVFTNVTCESGKITCYLKENA